MGVKTKVFGKFAWLVFEGIGRFYDEYMNTHQQNELLRLEMMDFAKEFFMLVGFVLPCVYCRISYRSFIDPECDKSVVNSVSVDQMLIIKDGGKKLVFKLHNRVTQKLWDQEREEFANNPEKLEEINAKWKLYSISYEQALKERYPAFDSIRFWNALIVFLGLIMCDYREEDACHIYRFFWSLGKLFCRSKHPLSAAYTDGLEKSLPLWKMKDMDKQLSIRLDIVWVIKQHVFAVNDWKFYHTRASFEEQCRDAIVGCGNK